MTAEILARQDQLQTEATELLRSSELLPLLRTLGMPIQTGSSVTGLMVYPDIDFSVQNDNFAIEDAIALTPRFFDELHVSALKIANFAENKNEGAGYYIGFEMPFAGRSWKIDATVGSVGPITTSPLELAGWIEGMTDAERVAILTLKEALIKAGRYVGARSRPPYTFRSSHLYEAVLRGGAKTIADLEEYYAS